jgi:hypothetical protein
LADWEVADMTARFLMPPVAIAALVALSGCPTPDEAAKPGASRAEDPEVAPPPRLKGPVGTKTLAELIVGKWRLVREAPAWAVDYQETVEYTADGRYSSTSTYSTQREKKLRRADTQCLYRLEGNQQHLLTELGTPFGETRWPSRTEIALLTEESLVLVTHTQRLDLDTARGLAVATKKTPQRGRT